MYELVGLSHSRGSATLSQGLAHHVCMLSLLWLLTVYVTLCLLIEICAFVGVWFLCILLNFSSRISRCEISVISSIW